MNLSLCFMSACAFVGSQPKDMRESTSVGSEPNMENWLDTSFDMWGWEYNCVVSWDPSGYIDCCCCCALANMF